jgi:hypothetical protein
MLQEESSVLDPDINDSQTTLFFRQARILPGNQTATFSVYITPIP